MFSSAMNVDNSDIVYEELHPSIAILNDAMREANQQPTLIYMSSNTSVCRNCGNQMEPNQCLLCDNCDLCLNCIDSVAHGLDLQNVHQKPPDNSIQSNFDETRKHLVESLVHASRCGVQCGQQSCLTMKNLVAHVKVCNWKFKGSCTICKQLIDLCHCHAKICNDTACLVPFCANIKHKMHRPGTEKAQLVDLLSRFKAPECSNIENTPEDSPRSVYDDLSDISPMAGTSQDINELIRFVDGESTSSSYNQVYPQYQMLNSHSTNPYLHSQESSPQQVFIEYKQIQYQNQTFVEVGDSNSVYGSETGSSDVLSGASSVSTPFQALQEPIQPILDTPAATPYPIEWQQSVSSENRTYSVQKLVQAMYMVFGATMTRMQSLITYAKKIENEIHGKATSSQEYYQLIGEQVKKCQTGSVNNRTS